MGETPLSDFDEPEVLDALESVFDKPLVPVAKRQQQRDASYRQLALDTRALTYQQRVFIRMLLGCGMNMRAACRKMNAAGIKIDQKTPVNWMGRPAFKSVVDRYTDLMCTQAGVTSPSQTVLRINEVVEDALVPVPMVHNGQGVVIDGERIMEVDRGSALKGLEMIGKFNGAFRKDEENSQRVTVVLDFSGEAMQGEQESERIENAIDGDFAEVPK